MKNFLTKPSTQSALRQTAAYALFFLFAAGALLVTWRLRENVLELSALLQASPSTFRTIYTWGTYPLFIPYVFAIVVIEAYLSGGAKKHCLGERAVRVFTIEAALAVASLVTTGIIVGLLKVQVP
jgi:hypothetical protein